MARLIKVGAGLPRQLGALREAARREGLRAIVRLEADWTRDAFGGSGVLIGVWAGGRLVGIGGLTVDPVMPGALRLRRLYVLRAARGAGVGRALVAALLVRAGPVTVVVNAPVAARRFWARLGFRAARRDGHTHAVSPHRPAVPPPARPRRELQRRRSFSSEGSRMVARPSAGRKAHRW